MTGTMSAGEYVGRLMVAAVDHPAETIVLGLLFAAAVHDARTGRLPDSIVLPAALVGALSMLVESPVGALLAVASGAAVVFVSIVLNEASWRLWGTECFGLGDAKWTAAAMVAFGGFACACAWGVGAILASGRLLAAHASGVPVGPVRFGPYLFAGLASTPLVAAAFGI